MDCFEEHSTGHVHQPAGGLSLRLRKEMRSEMCIETGHHEGITKLKRVDKIAQGEYVDLGGGERRKNEGR